MSSSTDWSDVGEGGCVEFTSGGFPPSQHPAEADLFVRQFDVPGHDQTQLSTAKVLMVGAGGLGSWAGLALVRGGVTDLTIIDADRFDRTNAPRQLVFPEDLGRPKAEALAKNLLPHMIGGGRITAVDAPFEDIDLESLAISVALFLVDNNECRLRGVQYARSRNIPAVFSMLSRDAMRMHTFLQGPHETDACLWCALPNLDPEASTPCVSGIITSCLAAASSAVFFAHRAIMGWPQGTTPFNWREDDLMGSAPARTGFLKRRPGCAACGLEKAELPR